MAQNNHSTLRNPSSAMLFTMFLPLLQRMPSIFLEYSNHGNSLEQICAVGGSIKTASQVYTSDMQHLMLAILPQETARYIIYSALVGYEGRGPVLAIVLGEFLLRKCSHVQSAFGFGCRDGKGKTWGKSGSPLHRILS